MSFGGYIEGHFQKGKLHGKGLVYFPNGDFYEGSFWEGKRNNECLKFSQAKNEWRLQMFENGEAVKTLDEGDGRPISFRNFIQLVSFKCNETREF